MAIIFSGAKDFGMADVWCGDRAGIFSWNSDLCVSELVPQATAIGLSDLGLLLAGWRDHAVVIIVCQSADSGALFDYFVPVYPYLACRFIA